MASVFFEKYFGNGESKLKSISFLILFVLMFIFVITQFVKVAKSSSTPLFAYVFEENANPSELFPIIAVCPGLAFNTTPVIVQINCNFSQSAGQNTPLPESYPKDFIIDGVSRSCFVMNQDQTVTANSYTDLIRCSVDTNTDTLIAFYDNRVPVPTNWFGWQSLPYQHDTALGIVKWMFNGREAGFQVETVDDEYRFKDPKLGVLFTIEWDFLGEGVYGEVPTYDFWTAVGVIGGYVFIATQLYAFLVWSGIYIFRINTENENAHQPIPTSHYGAL